MKSKNERNAVLIIFKSPEIQYNSNSLSKILKISAMGSLKLLKRLEKEGILISYKVSNINFYKTNFDNPSAIHYISFLLREEVKDSSSYVKRWVNEIRKIKEADSAILFGSVLKNLEKANDIDVLFILKKENFKKLGAEIEKLNIINEKRMHPIYQTREDLILNIQKKDKVILNSIKGVCAFGENEIVKIFGEVK